jgi:hypothetical protein
MKQPNQQLDVDFTIYQSPPIDEALLARALMLRYPVRLCLSRGLDEFQTLLRIPATFLVTLTAPSGELLAYGIAGKGYDMVGVIHEWGSTSPEFLIHLIHCLQHEFELSNMLLLSPEQLDDGYFHALKALGAEPSHHPMALAKNIGKGPTSDFRELFIWGIDSI